MWWPGASTYIVADLHLGRAELMGTRGIALPVAMTGRLLESLAGEIERWNAKRLLVLGDLLHGPAGITPELIGRVAAWRAACPCEMIVVPGNHDRKIERVEREWGMTVTESVWRDGPFQFAHAPGDLTSGVFGWCGHVHPAITMKLGPDAIKLRSFHISDRVGILPAMCPLASGGGIRSNSRDRIFAIAGGQVLEVRSPPKRATARRTRS
ncbi:MAG: metallophosphoesterase [Phycisphaerales bacterium]